MESGLVAELVWTLGPPCDNDPWLIQPQPRPGDGFPLSSTPVEAPIRLDPCQQPGNYIERVFERRRHAGRLVQTASPMTGIAATAVSTA